MRARDTIYAGYHGRACFNQSAARDKKNKKRERKSATRHGIDMYTYTSPMKHDRRVYYKLSLFLTTDVTETPIYLPILSSSSSLFSVPREISRVVIMSHRSSIYEVGKRKHDIQVYEVTSTHFNFLRCGTAFFQRFSRCDTRRTHTHISNIYVASSG